jgi:hypothetical protein
MEESGMTTIFRTAGPTTTTFRTTTDASSTYRERAGLEVARANSSSDNGNLAAVTKNSTFKTEVVQAPVSGERPRSLASTAVD